jgi:hypothetical protein
LAEDVVSAEEAFGDRTTKGPTRGQTGAGG